MNEIIVHVTVEGGVIQHVECPRGVRVVVRDYDVDGSDKALLQRDDEGDYYCEAIWGNDE